MVFKRIVLSIAIATASITIVGCGKKKSSSGSTTTTPSFTMSQTISDTAQRTTLAFAALAMMGGDEWAQTFFPPGKVADYTGFQYLRDNDPSGMGHNTSFLTRVAYNVIYILSDTQMAQLKSLATSQQTQVEQYGYKRFPLIRAFRNLMAGTLPSGTTALSLTAIKQASSDLYAIDGEVSFDRALVYANILNSMNEAQVAYLASMKGKGWSDWPAISDDQVRSKMSGGNAVAIMTYAGDLFSWYAGSIDADVYFCPERHGTYFGSFYMKDAPAIGHEGYSIDTEVTAVAGAGLSDASKGYVTESQATTMSSLVETQRSNLYAGTTSIVSIRTQIATLLRSLLASTATSDAIKAQVIALSRTYGELDGENNYNYAKVFAQVYNTLTTEQKAKIVALRKSLMAGTYSDGTAFDFSTTLAPYLYSTEITSTVFSSNATTYTSLFQ